MAKPKKLNDDREKIAKNIQKQYQNLFSGQDAPPAPINVRQMEELKARVAELESELKESRANQQNEMGATEPILANFESKPVSSKDSEIAELAQERVPELDSQSLATHSVIDATDDQHTSIAISQESTEDAAVKRGQRNLWQWLVEPPSVIVDGAQRRQASLVSALLLVLILAMSSGPFAQMYVVHNPINALILAGMLLGLIIAYIFSRTKNYRLSVPLLLVAVAAWPVLSIALAKNYSPVDLLTTFIFDVLIIILSGTLASFQTTVFLSVANFLGLLLLPVLIPAIPVGSMVIPLSFNGVVSVLILVFTQHRNLTEADRLAEVSQINRTLETSNTALDARTRALNLAAKVGNAIAEKVGNLYDMLTQATELIRSNFNLYYTQVYLVDPSGRTLALRAGTGEIGQALLQRGHHLLVGSGSLNGRAVFEKKPVIVTDTAMNPNFLPNPLLPNTRSEMAIPLIAGEQVLGVLDMQSEQAGALNETNLPTFEALAGQLAVAIQNANLFTEVEQARNQMEMQVQTMTERGWQDFLNAIERGQKVGFSFDQQGVVPLKADALSESAVENALSVPITVTGEQIGVIQLGDGPNRTWTGRETEIVQVAARQLAQHVDNLRLLAQADHYRAEAEQAARRLTREGWDVYLQSRGEQAAGYKFDLNEVQPLNERSNGDYGGALKYPLVVRDESFGELIVDSVDHSDQATEIAATVAQQLSAHLEDLRLTEQTESALNETETLYKASAELNSAKTYDQILDVLRRYTWLGHDALNVSVSFFDRPWSSDEAPTWINTLASWTSVPSRATVNRYLLSDFSSAQELLHPDAPTLIEDVAGDPKMDDNARKLYAVQFGAKSTIFVPLVVSGQWLGYINAMYQQATSFPEAEIRKLVAVSGQAAVAINNIRLLMMTQERVKREQSLREITAAVRSSTNPVTIMRTAVRELGNMLGRKTVVKLSAPEQADHTEFTANDGNEPVPPATQLEVKNENDK